MRRLSVVAVLVLLAVFSGWADVEGETIQEGVWSLYWEAYVSWGTTKVGLFWRSHIADSLNEGFFDLDSAEEDEFTFDSFYSELCVRVTRFTVEVSNAAYQPSEPSWVLLWEEDDETGQVTLTASDGYSYELRRMESKGTLLFLMVRGVNKGGPSVSLFSLQPPDPRCDALK